MSAESPVLFKIDADGVGTLTLNRPAQLNAFDLSMIEAWRAALEWAQRWALRKRQERKPPQAQA